MAQFMVEIQREHTRRLSIEQVKEQIELLAARGIAGTRDNWELTEMHIPEPEYDSSPIIYRAMLEFTSKNKPKNPTKEMTDVCKYIAKKGSSTTFKDRPWTIPAPPQPSDFVPGSGPPAPEGEADYMVDFNAATPLNEITFDDVLIHGTDEQIENYGPFKGIYGRAPHIRVCFSSIKTMIDTGGKRRNHVVFYGLPGAAKSTLFRAIQEVLGKGSYLGINSNSATKAGIESLFLSKLKETGTPPFIFIEEIEKTNEAILNTWLSILDERREVRKLTHTRADKASANVLCFATANDKELFDKLAGGRDNHPGALSSRFNKQLYVARPTREQMRLILKRDVDAFGGRDEWIDKCLEIMDELHETDPRVVLGYLDGADRLMDGSYKRDLKTIHEAEVRENR
jgi:hypothetical protein